MSVLIPIVLAITNIFGGLSQPAATTMTPTVYVQESVSSRADLALRQAIRFDNRYTRDRMVVHQCNASHYCIRIRYGTPSIKGAIAETSRGAHTATITVNRKMSASYTVKVRMYEHELGHAFGLGHNPKCTSLMYAYLGCNRGHGRVSPERFTTGERKILRNA